jgi:hypothetical protein
MLAASLLIGGGFVSVFVLVGLAVKFFSKD